MSSDTVIKVEGLSKCYEIYAKPHHRLLQMLFRGRKQFYREFWALRDVSFEIKRGETVGISGRNGSGKSTLLQMICGTLNPSAGNITVKGRVAALLELGAGFNPEFTGRENVYMAASLYGLNRAEVDQRFSYIEKFADIGAFIEQPVKTYSSGMYVRLAFAVIAHVDADILVIDEALAVGDAFFTQKCMRFLRQFKRMQGTLLFVSHDTGAVQGLCDRVLWLQSGGLVNQGAPKEVCELYLVEIYKSTQGVNVQSHREKLKVSEAGTYGIRDCRTEQFESNPTANEIFVVPFDETSSAFGIEGAKISKVEIQNKDGETISFIHGGEIVRLLILVETFHQLNSPIVGFYVKDKNGQALFGDNTFLSYCDQPVAVQAEQRLEAVFTFVMPRLMRGNYMVAAAVADGSQDEHVQHHWLHDALHFVSHCTSVSSGIVGLPMMDIKLCPTH